jgi:hypothetical protein
LLALTVAPVELAAQQGKPSAMVAFEQSRRTAFSGRVEWVALPDGDEDRGVRYVGRYARNGDFICESRGDKDGWQYVDPDRATLRSTKYPQLFLENAEGSWHTQETGLSCEFHSRDEQVPQWGNWIRDIRYAGATPTHLSLRPDRGFSVITEQVPDVEITEWNQTRKGELYVVTGRDARGQSVTWHINPTKGWNAELIEHRAADGKLIRRATCELCRYGDTWLPERTDYFGADGKVYWSVRITSARLNARDDPQQFTPADLNLEVGTNIGWVNDPAREQDPNRGVRVRAWDGHAVIPFDEYAALVAEGKRVPGPTFQRMKRGEPFSSPYDTEEDRARRRLDSGKLRTEQVLNRHQTLWEQYVRDFIRKYQLSQEQSREAFQILKQCQEAAEQQTNRLRLEFVPLWTERQQGGKDFDPKKEKRLEELVKSIQERVDKVFETQLKPRLDKLPTRAQRKAAEAATTTQSAQELKP